MGKWAATKFVKNEHDNGFKVPRLSFDGVDLLWFHRAHRADGPKGNGYLTEMTIKQAEKLVRRIVRLLNDSEVEEQMRKGRAKRVREERRVSHIPRSKSYLK